MVKEILTLIARRIQFPILIGFVLVFWDVSAHEIIPIAAKLGGITLIVILLFMLADRSKFLWAILLGGIFGVLGSLFGYFVGAIFYDAFF